VNSISVRIALAAAAVVAAASVANSQAPPPAGPVGCAELREMQASHAQVRKSLAVIEQMGQMLQEQAKSKSEEIAACTKSTGDPACTPALQSRREEEVGKLMGQVRELRTTRSAIEETLKEATEHLKELTAAQSGKDGCPDVPR
jgi:hypothetical protein